MLVWDKIKWAASVAFIFIVSLIAVFFKGRREGKKDAVDERNDDVLKEHVETQKQVAEVDNEIAKMSDPDVDKRLNDDWMRD
jgi:uncharacterized protein YlxW (UPF0749 family)